MVPCFMHNPMDSSPSRPPSAGLSGTLWRSIQGRVSSLAGLLGRHEDVRVPSAAAPAAPVSPEEHPSGEEVERLFRGDLPVEAVRRILAHLLPGCPVCQELTADLWRMGLETDSAATAPASDGSQYDATVGQVFDRVRQARRRLEAERAAACEALKELEAHSQARRRLLIQNRSDLQRWGVCEGLLARAEEGPAPEASVVWAELAVAVARQLDPARYPAPSLYDLQARSWTALAAAHQRCGELSAADEALQSAWDRLGRGTGDRVEKARLLESESALRHAQGRHREAARQLDRAILLYRRTGQRHLWSRALIRQGHARVLAGDLEGGIALVHQALQGADPVPDFGVWGNWRRPSSLALLQGLAGRFRRARR